MFTRVSPTFAHCFGCSHILFFSFSGREIFRTILEACNTFGFICYTERNFIAFERVLFLSGLIKRNVENFLIIRKLLKNFEMEKKAPKNVLSYYPVARWNFAFSRLLIIFRIFRIFIRVDLILKKIRLFRLLIIGKKKRKETWKRVD